MTPPVGDFSSPANVRMFAYMRSTPPTPHTWLPQPLHRVLVVTVDHGLADALAEALAVWGYATAHVTSTEEAIVACEVLHPSIVLLDLLGDAALTSLLGALHSVLRRDTPPMVVLSEEPPRTRRGEDVVTVQTPFVMEDLQLALEEACRDGRMLVH